MKSKVHRNNGRPDELTKKVSMVMVGSSSVELIGYKSLKLGGQFTKVEISTQGKYL